jgi:hypothetical protein
MARQMWFYMNIQTAWMRLAVCFVKLSWAGYHRRHLLYIHICLKGKLEISDRWILSREKRKLDLDEKTGTLYVYEYPMYGGLPDPSNGFYRLDFETGKYEMIIPQPENSDIFSGWSTRLNAVVVEYFNYPDVMSTVVLDSLGKKLFEFAGSMSVSPNCQLILVAGDDGSALFDGGGQFVRDISNETYRGVIWSFDSNGFYRLESTSTYLHTMENNWIGETILGPCADFELFHP